MSLGDGVDFDPNSVGQIVRHELGETKMQAHVYGEKTITAAQQQYNISGAARTDQFITDASRPILIPQLRLIRYRCTMKKTLAASCSARKMEVSLGNFSCLKKQKVWLGDGVDFDPNSVRQRVRHELGTTKVQAHVYGKETVRRDLDSRTPPSQQYNSITTVEQHVPTNP